MDRGCVGQPVQGEFEISNSIFPSLKFDQDLTTGFSQMEVIRAELEGLIRRLKRAIHVGPLLKQHEGQIIPGNCIVWVSLDRPLQGASRNIKIATRRRRRAESFGQYWRQIGFAKQALEDSIEHRFR